MTYTPQELAKLDAAQIANTASRKHIQSVLETLIATAQQVREECAAICYQEAEADKDKLDQGLSAARAAKRIRKGTK
jgi:hypothetical protein